MAEGWFKGILGFGKNREAAPKASRQAGTTPEDVWADHDRAVARQEDEMWQEHDMRERASKESESFPREAHLQAGEISEGEARKALNECFKYPHVQGSLERSLAYARSAGLEEEARSMAKEKVVEFFKTGNVSAGQRMGDALHTLEAYGLRLEELDTPGLETTAKTLLRETLVNVHVYGTARMIERFAAFMGPSFVQDPEVKEMVVDKFKERIRIQGLDFVTSMHHDLADMNLLISVFELSDEDTAPFMTPELKEALAIEPWTSREIDEAHSEWAREEQEAGREPGYNTDFHVDREMPKRRPK